MKFERRNWCNEQKLKLYLDRGATTMPRQQQNKHQQKRKAICAWIRRVSPRFANLPKKCAFCWLLCGMIEECMIGVLSLKIVDLFPALVETANAFLRLLTRQSSNYFFAFIIFWFSPLSLTHSLSSSLFLKLFIVIPRKTKFWSI